MTEEQEIERISLALWEDTKEETLVRSSWELAAVAYATMKLIEAEKHAQHEDIPEYQAYLNARDAKDYVGTSATMMDEARIPRDYDPPMFDEYDERHDVTAIVLGRTRT